VITNNREYRTLQLGLRAVEQIYDWHPAGDPWYLRLDEHPMSFVSIAAAFGIDGALVSRLGELADGLRAGLDAVEAGRPFVLEVLTDPSPQPPPQAVLPRLDVFQATKEQNDVGQRYGRPV
jgi:thiamine pyrophosphate-dependent acetolactate synthase large subunit-like protein